MLLFRSYQGFPQPSSGRPARAAKVRFQQHGKACRMGPSPTWIATEGRNLRIAGWPCIHWYVCALESLVWHATNVLTRATCDKSLPLHSDKSYTKLSGRNQHVSASHAKKPAYQPRSPSVDPRGLHQSSGMQWLCVPAPRPGDNAGWTLFPASAHVGSVSQKGSERSGAARPAAPTAPHVRLASAPASVTSVGAGRLRSPSGSLHASDFFGSVHASDLFGSSAPASDPGGHRRLSAALCERSNLPTRLSISSRSSSSASTSAASRITPSGASSRLSPRPAHDPGDSELVCNRW